MTTQELALDDIIKKEKQQRGLQKGNLKSRNSKVLIIENLHLEVNDAELYKIFAEKGSLVKCKV